MQLSRRRRTRSVREWQRFSSWCHHSERYAISPLTFLSWLKFDLCKYKNYGLVANPSIVRASFFGRRIRLQSCRRSLGTSSSCTSNSRCVPNHCTPRYDLIKFARPPFLPMPMSQWCLQVLSSPYMRPPPVTGAAPEVSKTPSVLFF
jgi:hypothetical protein